MSSWLAIQNGEGDGAVLGAAEVKGPFHCVTPEVLGSKVHDDPLYQFYYNAALIALPNVGPEFKGNEYTTRWTTASGPDILHAVAAVAVGALRVAWQNKYMIGMKVRPEVYAQRVEVGSNDATLKNSVPGLATIVDAFATMPADLFGANKFLQLQFPEGSPTHPAWPAGHSTVAGAGVTVLKAMLRTHNEDGTRRLWSDTGLPLYEAVWTDGTKTDTKLQAAPAAACTIIGELNKLGSNVAIGRDWAGVHTRCDGDCGVKLGEEYAISFLVDKAKEYHESYTGEFTGFTLEKYDGTTVLINANGVTQIFL